jgi:hypothetical protein
VIESAIPRTHGKATGQTNEQQQKAFRAYKDALSELMNHEWSRTMTKFDPELVQVMRAALEEIMQRVPVLDAQGRWYTMEPQVNAKGVLARGRATGPRQGRAHRADRSAPMQHEQQRTPEAIEGEPQDSPHGESRLKRQVAEGLVHTSTLVHTTAKSPLGFPNGGMTL